MTDNNNDHQPFIIVHVEPKAYTKDEIREMFLKRVWTMVRYWAGLDGSNVPADYDNLQRGRGLAHSLLVTLDGGSMPLPGFKLIPDPHPDDREYHLERGERFFPDDVDIGGGLHELLYAEGIRRDEGRSI